MKVVLVALNAKYAHSSLALRRIQKFCSPFNVFIKEYTINQETDRIYADLLNEGADVYGFSCYIWNIGKTLELCECIHAARPNAVIILGGPEAGHNPGAMFDFANFVVTGEGEQATFDLLSALQDKKDPKDVKGIAFKGQINPPSDPVLFPMPYTEEDLRELEGKIIYYESMRGCPFRCSYCLSSIDKELSFLPLDKVKSELLFLINHDVPLVKFIDRTFNCDKKRALEIMQFLVLNKKNTRFHFELAGDLLDDETISFLKTVPSGLFQFEIGIQSTNEETLRAVNRNCDLKRAFDNIKKIENCHIHLDLIAGLPYEGYHRFSQSFNEVYSLMPDMLQLGFLKLLHGSPLRAQADEFGYKYTSFPPYEVIENRFISADEFISLKKTENAVDRVYNSGAFKNSLSLITGSDPFSFYESFGKVLFDMGSISLWSLFDLLYEFIGDERLCQPLTIDFLTSGGTTLPYWAKRKELPNFKENCFKYIKALYKDENANNLYKQFRFEAAAGRIFMLQRKTLELMDITKEWGDIIG